MTLDPQEIALLRRAGLKVTGPKGQALPYEAAARTELDYLREMVGLLTALLHRPNPESAPGPAPQVTVAAPPAEPRPRAWKFTLVKDAEGRTTQIIAEAME